MDVILTLLALGGAFVFAWWYLRRTETRRAEDEVKRQEAEALALSQSAGLAAGDIPLWDPADPDPLNRKILDDGLAHNSKWVTPAFRAVFWEAMDEGLGTGVAFYRAMEATHWRSGSRGQVYDRLYSHGLIDEATRDRWKRQSEQRHPSGYGTFSPPPQSAPAPVRDAVVRIPV